jgi:hypothetical protein
VSRRVDVGKKGIVVLGIDVFKDTVQVGTWSESTAYSRNAPDEVADYLRNENRLIVHRDMECFSSALCFRGHS